MDPMVILGAVIGGALSYWLGYGHGLKVGGESRLKIRRIPPTTPKPNIRPGAQGTAGKDGIFERPEPTTSPPTRR